MIAVIGVIGLLSFAAFIVSLAGLFLTRWRRRSAFAAGASFLLFVTAIVMSPTATTHGPMSTATATTATGAPNGPSESSLRENKRNARYAFAFCEASAKDTLRDPSSAEFLDDYSGFDDAILRRKNADDYYDVILKVRAANGFGGKSVAFIVCTVHHSRVAASDEGWQTVNLQELDPAAVAPTDIPSAENTPAINCATTDALECHSDLPPGLVTYSNEEISQRQTECTAGAFQSCYDLCRHRLNGNRPGYTCPVVNYDHDVTSASKILKDTIACDDAKDEDFAEILALRESDQAVRDWILKNHKACEFLKADSSIRLLQESPDGYHLVAIENEHWHRRWVTGLDLIAAGAH